MWRHNTYIICVHLWYNNLRWVSKLSHDEINNKHKKYISNKLSSWSFIIYHHDNNILYIYWNKIIICQYKKNIMLIWKTQELLHLNSKKIHENQYSFANCDIKTTDPLTYKKYCHIFDTYIPVHTIVYLLVSTKGSHNI